MTLSNKRVFMTGASGGLGQAVARRLTADGAHLCVAGRRDDGVVAAAEFVKADLATEDGIQNACSALASREIDILVNLAGIQHFGPLESQPADHTMATFLVNLIAPVMLTQAALHGMRARGSGQIANLGSIFGSINYAHFVTYSSAKAGLHGFSEALRRELKGTDIAVTYIAPRAVATGLSRGAVLEFTKLSRMSLDAPDRVADRIVNAIAARRKDVFLGLPENVFVRLNAVLPRLVDLALAGNDRKAKSLFTPKLETDISK